MKKLMYLMLIVLSCGLISCQNVDSGVSGYTFSNNDDDGYMSITFHPNKTCSIEFATETYFSSSAFTYVESNSDIRIYFDRSYTWIEEARGTLYMTCTYNQKEKKLWCKLTNGSSIVLTREK